MQKSATSSKLKWDSLKFASKNQWDVNNYLSTFYVVFPWSRGLENVTSCSVWLGVHGTPGVYAPDICRADHVPAVSVTPYVPQFAGGPLETWGPRLKLTKPIGTPALARNSGSKFRWRTGQGASLGPPCSNLRSFGSKCIVLKKLFGAWRPAHCTFFAPLGTPLPERQARKALHCGSKQQYIPLYYCLLAPLGSQTGGKLPPGGNTRFFGG